MNEKFQCEICGKNYSALYLKKHSKKCKGPKAKRTGDPVVCSVCGNKICYDQFPRHMTGFHHLPYEKYQRRQMPPAEEHKQDERNPEDSPIKQALRALAHPTGTVYGRQAQRELLRSLFLAGDRHFILVHGSPGIGKTATVNDVLDELEEKGRRVIRLSGATCAGPDDEPVDPVQPQGRKRSQKASTRNLIARLKAAVRKDNGAIVLIDELGYIGPYAEIYQIYKAVANGILVGIESNEEDVAGITTAFMRNQLNVTKIAFSPYTTEEIISIFDNVLGVGNTVFDKEAIKSIAQETRTLHGSDMRFAFRLAADAIQKQIKGDDRKPVVKQQVELLVASTGNPTLAQLMLSIPRDTLLVALGLYKCLRKNETLHMGQKQDLEEELKQAKADRDTVWFPTLKKYMVKGSIELYEYNESMRLAEEEKDIAQNSIDVAHIKMERNQKELHRLFTRREVMKIATSIDMSRN